MLKGIQLTLLIGPTVPVPVPQVVLDALTSIEVRSETSGPSTFTLQFTISTRSPLHTLLLLNGGSIQPDLRAIIVVTINGTPSVLMDGLVTEHSTTPGEGGHAMLTLTGEDLTRAMDKQELDGAPYPAMPAEARVALILLRYARFGVIPVVIPTLFMDVPIPVVRYPVHKGTDLYYILQLARNAGYTFYVEPGPVPGTNTAYWGPEIKVGVPQPALNIDMDAFTNVEKLSFRLNNTKKTLPIVYIQNEQTKSPIPIPIPDFNPLQPPLGLIPLPIQKIKPLKHTAKLSPQQAVSEGVAEAAASQDSVIGNGSLDVLRYGRPLKARGLVGVRGVGLAFDGLYFVRQVTSTITRGSFKQSFELSRNGLVSITPVVSA